MSWITFLLIGLASVFSTSVQAQLPPFPYQEDIQHCWSSLQSINGCVPEIYTSFINGRVGALGPACCKAITDISSSCWPKMFPFNPYFPPLLNSFCTKTGEAAALSPTPAPKVVFPSDPLSVASGLTGYEPQEQDESLATIGFGLEPNSRLCLQSLVNTQGCIQEVITSFFSFQVRLIGPSCCNATIKIDTNCWPTIFPFNPFFPPLVKNYCINLVSRHHHHHHHHPATIR